MKFGISGYISDDRVGGLDVSSVCPIKAPGGGPPVLKVEVVVASDAAPLRLGQIPRWRQRRGA